MTTREKDDKKLEALVNQAYAGVMVKARLRREWDRGRR
jgi:hypothetical protein